VIILILVKCLKTNPKETLYVHYAIWGYPKGVLHILIVGFSILLRVYSQSQIKPPYATQFLCSLFTTSTYTTCFGPSYICPISNTNTLASQILLFYQLHYAYILNVFSTYHMTVTGDISSSQNFLYFNYFSKLAACCENLLSWRKRVFIQGFLPSGSYQVLTTRQEGPGARIRWGYHPLDSYCLLWDFQVTTSGKRLISLNQWIRLIFYWYAFNFLFVL
jgi:hypothetical protein